MQIPKILVIVLLFLTSLTTLAQATPPNLNPPPPGMPIDGFIWFGIIVAIGFGIYVYPERSRSAIS